MDSENMMAVNGTEYRGYMERRDFEHWGRTYWRRSPELLAHAARTEA